MYKFLVINGPNLNLLGTREPDIYGEETLDDVRRKVTAEAEKLGVHVDFFHSNHEGEIIDEIQKSRGIYEAIIMNPGAYAHYSIAIRDAIKSANVKVVEVHISNIHAREEFRAKSVVAPVCMGQISGFGTNSYIIGLHAAVMGCTGGKR